MPANKARYTRNVSVDLGDVRSSSVSMPPPIGKERTQSLSSSVGADSVLRNPYDRAPGHEREVSRGNRGHYREGQISRGNRGDEREGHVSKRQQRG